MKKKLQRLLAAFFIVNILFNTFLPTISFALTSGPTAPEATSFEPVDTTDMVNLVTGDFTYNMPLLEVPGPAGGYPISMAYHAGIQVNQEASWIGLGWNLNPGAINRTTSGMPDDYKNVAAVNRSFWQGGESSSFSLGVTVGKGGAGGISAGITTSYDTYKGFNSSFSLSAGGLSYTYSNDNGKTSSITGVTVGIKGVSVSANSQGVASINSVLGINLRPPEVASLANSFVTSGTSLATVAKDFALSKVGIRANTHNSKEGKVSTEGYDFALSVPTPWGFSFDFSSSYKRYWIDESVATQNYGSLYLPTTSLTDTEINQRAFDSYDLPVYVNNSLNYSETNLGGTFADYDQYSVAAQGIGGTIRPVHYKAFLHRQTKFAEDGTTVLTKSLSLGGSPKASFKFDGGFSNRYDYENFEFSSGNPLNYSFNSGTTITGENGNDGYSQQKNQLQGAKMVSWYTNQEIAIGQAKADGFVNVVNALGFIRPANDKIGGFKVVNDNGMVYHFALPAYSYGEYSYSGRTDEKGVESFNHYTQTEAYAHTWHLTAITGTDYVDKNSNGIADNGDWGYWVTFEYGLWAKNFRWRIPAEGYNADLDSEFKSASKGKKDIYYLNVIRTQTHAAVFVKEFRADAKSVTATKDEMVVVENKRVVYRDDGGFDVKGGWSPVSQLKLKEIVLLNVKDLPENLSEVSYVYQNQTGGNAGGFVVDVKDFEAVQAELKPKSLRSVGLESTNNLLCLGTPNSFLNSWDVAGTGLTANQQLKLGKLALTGVIFYGKAYANTLPKTLFNYDITKNPSYDKEKYDNWGMYKSDYLADDKAPSRVVRMVTETSASMLDAWCLKEIVTPTGAKIKINFEADRYRNALKSLTNLDIKSIEKYSNSPYRFKINLYNNISETSINAGYMCRIDVLFRQRGVQATLNAVKCNGTKLAEIFFWNPVISTQPTSQVIEKGDYHLIVDDWYLNSILKPLPNPIFIAEATFKPSDDERQAGAKYLFQDYAEVVSGHIYYSGILSPWGGGLRVNSLQIEDDFRVLSTKYQYEGGVTPYEPIGMQVAAKRIPSTYSPCIRDIESKAIKSFNDNSYQKNVFSKFLDVFAISRELPSPDVFYEKVSITDHLLDKASNVEIPLFQKTVHEFQVFSPDMVQRKMTYASVTSSAYLNGNLGVSKIIDNSAKLGAIKSIRKYSSDGKLLSELKNSYHSLDQNVDDYMVLLQSTFKNQGVIKETFVDARQTRTSSSANFNTFATISQKIKLPLISKATEEINYKTNVRTITEPKYFDFYSGQTIQTLTSDALGNYFVTEVTPAYKKYVDMGLAINGGKNMLTQQAASTTYKIDPVTSNKLGLVSATAQTWSDQTFVIGAGGSNISAKQPGIWRMKSSFNFVGEQSLSNGLRTDGLYKTTLFADFTNWNNHQEQTGWQKNSEVTLYDIYSHALEAKDVNQNFSATVMSQDQTRVVGTAANAQYDQIGYSSAEEQPKIGSFASQYELGNNIYLATSNGASWVQEKAHTGVSSLRAAPSQQAFLFSTGNSQSNTYRASVWSSQPGGKIKYHVDGGVSQTPIVKNIGKAGDWYLLEADISGVSGYDNVRIWCEGGSSSETYFDDFRVHPLDAAMTSYVYNNWGELTHILDNNNLYTKYVYDEMGRLKSTHREKFNQPNETVGNVKLSEIKYNYGLGQTQMINLKVNKLGPSGSISHNGNVAVLLNGSQTITFNETCPNQPVLEKVVVDGKSYSIYSGETTLPSGTKMVIARQVTLIDGNAYNYTTATFSNVTAQHNITAIFGQPAPPGNTEPTYSCEVSGGCLTGSVIMTTYDACGAITQRLNIGSGGGGLQCTNPPNSGCQEY